MSCDNATSRYHLIFFSKKYNAQKATDIKINYYYILLGKHRHLLNFLGLKKNREANRFSTIYLTLSQVLFGRHIYGCIY